MYYDRNSEDLDLPNFNFNLDNQKPVKKKETKDNKKKKIFIVISIVVGITVLAIIIFIVIYLSSKKKEDGGIIYATHEIDSFNPFTIINNDNLDENDIEIKLNMSDTISARLLDESGYTIEKNIFKLEQKMEGRITFEIKFNKKISSMSAMFQNMKNLVSVDLSNFKSEKVKNMDSTFAECIRLENINFSNFESKNVENMNNIFENCRELIEIDLSSFKTPKLKSMKSAFKNCINLFSLNLTGFIINNVDITDIFDNTTNLNKDFIFIYDNNTKDIIDSRTMNNTFDIKNCIKGDGEKCKDCKEEENEQYKCNSCNYGYYIPNNLINNIKCKKCYDNCKSCFGEYMNCTECIEGYEYIIDKNKCIKISSLSDQEFIITDTSTDFNFKEDSTNEIIDEDENTGILSDQ